MFLGCAKARLRFSSFLCSQSIWSNRNGVLYGKEEWLNKLPPYHGGGEMIASVSFEKTTFNELPYKFEAGTPDYVGSTSMAAGLDYIAEIGIENIAQYEHDLLEYATEQLLKINGLKIYGTSNNKASVISFLVDGIHTTIWGCY